MASEWLKLMLEEIARKRDEQERARLEEAQRERESTGAGAPGRRPGKGPASARREP